jgi:hypothetical protein
VGIGTGGANSREVRTPASRDLLRLRNSLVKLFTEMRGFGFGFAPTVPAAGTEVSSEICASDMKESSEKRLEGWGREKVRGGGSRTAGVAGRSATEEWPGDTEFAVDVRLDEAGSDPGADNDISLGATLFRKDESSPFTGEAF